MASDPGGYLLFYNDETSDVLVTDLKTPKEKSTF
jgi:hypothetical protein